MNNHIGEQYGHFEIVSRDTSKVREYYFIRCLNCGKIQEKSVRYDGIKSHSSGRMCECDKDLTGQIFGFLEIIGIDHEKSKEKRNTYYFCKCLKCKRDNIVSVRCSSLFNGTTKSCGCLNDESHRKDIRGQIFNDFLILDVDYEKTYNNERLSTGTYWRAKCQKCGKERSLIARDLFQGKVPSCECSKINSRGEELIKSILNNLNIEYEQQKIFNDLRNLNADTFLRLDFYLPKKNIAFEYQGIQHYEPVEHFGGKDKLVLQQNNDNLKREYCKSHNIKLIEIPYWDYDKLNEEYLLNLINS